MRCNRSCKRAREHHVRRRSGVDRLDTLRFERRQLHDRRERLARLQVPADAALDLREPCAESGSFTQSIEILVRLEQRFDQRILGIFLVAARPNQLSIDGVLHHCCQDAQLTTGACRRRPPNPSRPPWRAVTSPKRRSAAAATKARVPAWQ